MKRGGVSNFGDVPPALQIRRKLAVEIEVLVQRRKIARKNNAMVPNHLMAHEERKFLEQPHVVSAAADVDSLENLEQDRPRLGESGHDAEVDVPIPFSLNRGAEEKNPHDPFFEESEIGAQPLL